jgi:hypothetical protein
LHNHHHHFICIFLVHHLPPQHRQVPIVLRVSATHLSTSSTCASSSSTCTSSSSTCTSSSSTCALSSSTCASTFTANKTVTCDAIGAKLVGTKWGEKKLRSDNDQHKFCCDR